MNKTRTPKKPALQDWHRADIKAALEKAGWTLRALAIAHGSKHGTTLRQALDHPYPKAERIIAEAIGVEPAVIWPSRYANRFAKKCNTPQPLANHKEVA